MSTKKLMLAATQLNPLTAAAMRYVDERRAEQESIKANRIVQVLEFRIDNLKERLAKSDDQIRQIMGRLPSVLQTDSHTASYLASLVLANGGLSSKMSVADYYINQLTTISPIEAAIVYFTSGKVKPGNDQQLASELDTLEQIRLEYRPQLSSIEASLVSTGLLVDDAKAVEPILLELLSEN